MTEAALAGLRIVEVGTSCAAAYCGKLFADFGAEVVKIEPPGGDPLRRTWPQVPVGGGQTESGFAAWLNTNKHSVLLDPGIPDDQARLDRLAEGADVLIDASGGSNAAARHETVRRANPNVTIISLSWFGETGPYRDFAGTDSVCRALAGVVSLTGPEEGPPEMLCDAQAGIVAGLTAFTAALAARLSRDTGRRFELSVHEAHVVLAEYQAAVARSAAPDVPERRYGRNRFRPTFPLGIHRCREGWIGITIITPKQWRNFCDLLGIREQAADPRFATNLGRFNHADELEAIYAGRFAARTAEEWFALGREWRLPMVIVPDVPTLLGQRVHRERGAFAPVRIGEAVFEAPTVPHRLPLAPPSAGGTAPLPGECAASPIGKRPPSRATAAACERPLASLRIVDLTMGWAGPLATRQMADLGADVIKVEACAYPDWWRGVDHSEENVRERLYEKSLWFNVLNRNKRGITVDLTAPEGVALLKRLVATVDAVIENYSFDVLPKLGLTYDALHQVNPALVMVSMPAFGNGSWRDVRAYGSTLEQASGLPSVAGPPDGSPTLNQLAYGDPIGGLNGAVALLAALMHRKRTGLGQHVDLSQVQGMLPLLAPWIIEYGVAGKVTRSGNRHPGQAPHGCFRCKGADGWVAIAVADDAQWPGLCRVIGRDDLAALGSLSARQQAEDRIEAAIGTWTATVDAETAMAELQAAGVPAGVVRSPGGLYDDPHLRARGVWQGVERAWIGTHEQPSAPFREDGRPYPVLSPAPTLGEYNDAVLGGLLSLSEPEIAALSEAGVTGIEVIPVGRRRKRARPALTPAG